jgi:hypothetical protein
VRRVNASWRYGQPPTLRQAERRSTVRRTPQQQQLTAIERVNNLPRLSIRSKTGCLFPQAGIPTGFAFHELLPSRTDTIGSDSTPCWSATGVASCRIESIALEITLDERCPWLGPWGVVGPDRVVGHYEPLGSTVRSASSAKNARSCQKPRPGLHGRPIRSRPRIRVRDGTPGRPSDRHHVPRLGCLPSGYYAWRERPLSMRARADVKLSAEIQAIHRASRTIQGNIGPPRGEHNARSRSLLSPSSLPQ